MPFNFTPTGIGSMPYVEERPAIEIIKKTLHTIPHWPQLPNRGKQEDFVFQYLAPLVKLGLITVPEERAPYIDSEAEDFADKLTAFYELYLTAETGDAEALESFAFPKDSAAGFYAFYAAIEAGEFAKAEYVKGHISGPLSVALTLTDQNRRSVYYDAQLKDVIIKTLSLHARWQAQTLARLGKKTIVFIDDPSLYALGASTHITLTKDEVIEELQAVIDAIRSENALVGVHSCANVDWALLLNIGIDFLSFDAYGYFDNLLLYTEDITGFLKKGGNLAWGIVPTSEAILGESTGSLLDKLNSQINALIKKGVPKELIMSNSLLTPSCGTGTLTIEIAEKVYKTLGELAEKI